MNINNILNDFNLNKQDLYYILLLCLFSFLITFQMIKFQHIRGAINSDVYAYLATALNFAGLNHAGISSIGYFFTSPVICSLTALIFKLGYVDINAIYIVTGIFGIFGIFGMYVLLKSRFSPLLSFFGTILYSSFSLTLLYYANGLLDVPAVSMIIWTFVFTFAAVDRNPKYYLLVLLAGIITFFTRYASGFIIPIILLYILKNNDIIYLMECFFADKKVFRDKISSFLKSQEFKWIFISLAIGLILILFVLFSQNLNGVYYSMAEYSVSGFTNPLNNNYVTDTLFYLKNFLSFLFTDSITFNEILIEQFHSPLWFSYVIVGILFAGILLKLSDIIRNFDSIKKKNNELSHRNRNSAKVMTIAVLILALVGIISFKFNYFISLVSFWLIFLIAMSLIREYPIDKDEFTLYGVFAALFISYFIIFSFMNIKCTRYMLPAFPGFVFMTVYSLDYILKFVSDRFSDVSKNNVISIGVPIVLIVICLFFAFNFTSTVEISEESLDIMEICNFIKEYDPDYQDKSFSTVHNRFFEWYLQKDVKKLSMKNLNDTYVISDFKIKDPQYEKIYDSGYNRVYVNIQSE